MMLTALLSSLKIAMVLPVAYAALLSQCAPRVGQVTMSALVQYESGWHPWAIYDNATRRAYYPQSERQAIAIASVLIARGHAVDMGLAQIDSENLNGLGFTVDHIFDPCSNLGAGAHILQGAYFRAVRVYGPGTTALFHALESYNSNRLDGNPSYASGVFREALSGVVLAIPPIGAALAPSLAIVSVRTNGRTMTVRPAPTVLVWRSATVRDPQNLSGLDLFAAPDSSWPGATGFATSFGRYSQ